MQHVARLLVISSMAMICWQIAPPLPRWISRPEHAVRRALAAWRTPRTAVQVHYRKVMHLDETEDERDVHVATRFSGFGTQCSAVDTQDARLGRTALFMPIGAALCRDPNTVRALT